MSCFSQQSAYMRYMDDESDGLQTGRHVSDQQFRQKINQRPDIFALERDTFLRNIEICSQVAGLIAGVVLCSITLPEIIQPVFIEKGFTHHASDRTIELVPEPMSREALVRRYIDRPPELSKRTMRSKSSRTAAARPSQKGSVRSRIAKKIANTFSLERIFGHERIEGEWGGVGGHAKHIDKVLAGYKQGIKPGRSGGAGRRGASSIGFEHGAGGGGIGIGDRGSAPYEPELVADSVSLKPNIRKTIPSPSDMNLRNSRIIGGRSRLEIHRVVRQNLQALRYAYSRRLRSKPQLRGKILVRFAIDEFGRVIFCEVTESTIKDGRLEKEIVNKIRRWAFMEIDKPGDVTEVVYPFVFSS